MLLVLHLGGGAVRTVYVDLSGSVPAEALASVTVILNERLAGQSLRVISLTDPEHVERYGLQDLARDRNLELEFGLGDEADVEDQVDAKVA